MTDRCNHTRQVVELLADLDDIRRMREQARASVYAITVAGFERRKRDLLDEIRACGCAL